VQDTAQEEEQEEIEEDDETGTNNKIKFNIPKSLKILPTDSEEVRQHKRKRIRIIKAQFRKKKMEEDRTDKKNAWKEFTAKSTSSKKLKTGFLTGRLNKESIFKSPDSVGGKVGVVGSGKALTPSPTAPLLGKGKVSLPDQL